MPRVYDVDPDGSFTKSLNDAIKKIGDLTIPFKLMTREWFKGNRSIFDEGRKGPGKYADLSAKYKIAKTKAIGSPYPILRGFLRTAGGKAKKSGKLAKSMIKPGDSGSVSTIVNKNILILGTKVTGKGSVPYPTFLHLGTKDMPARPFVLIGGEQVATNQVNKRRKNWGVMLQDYVFQVSKGFASSDS